MLTGVSTTLRYFADELFRWEDLDQRLLSPKTNNLAQEMHQRAAEAQRRIAYETAQSGNSAGYLPRWIDFHEQLADEWAEKLYAAHCQTWTEQNRTISPTFIRVVRDRAIAPLIDVRKSTVQFEVGSHAVRIGDAGNPQNSAVIGEWIRRMDRLAARWTGKLEAEAVAAEYRAAKASQVSPHDLPRPPLVMPDESNSVLQSNVWRIFHQTFGALADEESRLEPSNMHNRWLRAYASYEDKSLKWGSWLLSRGENEGFKERFEVAATRAGIALRLGLTGKPFEGWLYHVFLDLLEHQSKLLFAGTRDEGGIIVRVCEASAVYCSRLEKNALQAENDGKKSHEPTSVESTVPSRPSPSRSRPGRTSARSADFVNLAGKLWLHAKRESGNASVTGKQLNQIASSLDDQKYVPPAKYLEGSCAIELRAFNSKNSHSKIGPIQTWSKLVALGDKDHLRGMRRLLSRCAEKHAL